MAYQFNLIAQASHDEEGNLYGGQLGDQIGFELNARHWFDYDWTAVYRPNSSDLAEGVCDFMQRAILNGFIGYSSNRATRQKFFDMVKALNFKVEEVAEPCACDCSSSIFTALNSVVTLPFEGYDDINNVTVYVPLVRHYDAFLMSTGRFAKLTDTKYLTSGKELKRGDILLNANHVAVWI